MALKALILFALLAFTLQASERNLQTCTILNCATCDPTGTKCQTCNMAYYFDYTLNECTNCKAPCETCTNATFCTACYGGYDYQQTTGTCTVTCQLTGCSSCVQPNFCELCSTGYTLDRALGTCLPSTAPTTCTMTGCLNCTVTPTGNACLICDIGYIIDQNTMQCNKSTAPTTCTMTNCANCSVTTTGNVCLLCNTGFIFDPSTMQCAQSSTTPTICTMTNCANCSVSPAGNVCLLCNTGFVVDPTNLQCVQSTGPTTCTMVGCLNCTVMIVGNICMMCDIGYLLDKNTGQCNKTITPITTTCPTTCTNCSSTGLCFACIADANKYLPSPTKKECITCDTTLPNMVGCVSCATASSCAICASGYQLSFVQNSGICIKCAISNCLECALSGSLPICAVCAPGYNPILLGEACSQCSFPCATCNSNAAPKNCQTCTLPYFFAMPAADGTCIKNYIRGCVRPNLNNVTLCGLCDTGFTLSPDGLSCNFTCSLGCTSCTSATSCTTCVEGFYLTQASTCEKCIVKGCLKCANNGASCTSCVKGFYIVGTDCAPCPSFCLDCTSNTSCSSLSEQSQVLMTIGGQTVLASCDVTCLKCSDTDRGVCFTCLEGYLLNPEGKCFKCDGNCKTCDSTNTSKCLSCFTNQFLSATNLCVACNKNCKTCLNGDNPNNCTSCWDGFSLNSTASCVKGCPKNCIYCSSLTTCTECNSGYTTYKSNGSVLCVPCVTNCRTCAEGKPSVCLNCGSGFYLEGSTCKKCAKQCSKCTANGCTTCYSGYYLNADQICAPRCKFPCATCSVTSGQSCLSCAAGYSLNGTTCAPVSNCTSCALCPDGFVLKDGKCAACLTGKCQSCSTALDKCYSCQRGFFLTSAGTCELCPVQCQGCLSATGCMSCATGYTIKDSAVQTASGFECVKCNSPCATCQGNPDYCLTCVDGYTFSGWKCTQNFKFTFNLTLTVDMAVFEEKYMAFILALANATKILDINGITLNSIKSGSTIVEGNLAPEAASGTAESGVQLDGLKTALAGASIEGMPIGSSSIVVEEGVAGAEESSSKNMLPIILVIVGVVVFFIYGKKTPTNVSRFDTEGDENKGEKFNKSMEQMVVQ